MAIYKSFRGDIDIFVPKGQERRYLKKYKMEVRYLPNGAMLAAATRKVDDTADVRINMHFPHASYQEPIGKRGVSHLVEHFIFNKPHFLANEKEAYYNAHTYGTHMELVMRGRAHHQVRDLGILPVVPVALDQVAQPLKVTETDLNNEKKVVLGELHEYLSEYKDEQISFFEKIFFTSDHPHIYNSLGTKGDIRRLTIQDVKEYHRRVFIPNGMITTVFVDGSPKITNKVLNEVEKRISTMAKRRGRPMRIDMSLFRKINPRYKQGVIHKKASKKNDKQLKIHYVWLFPRKDYSVQTFAESRFFDVAQQRMFKVFRKKGLGYTADPVDVTIGDDKRVLGFVITIAKKGKNAEQQANEIFKELHKEIFELFSDADISEMLKAIKNQSIAGISVSDRFSDVVTGLKEYGRIIDSDKVQEIRTMITPDHLRSAQQQFLSIPPTMLIEGDLS